MTRRGYGLKVGIVCDIRCNWATRSNDLNRKRRPRSVGMHASHLHLRILHPAAGPGSKLSLADSQTCRSRISRRPTKARAMTQKHNPREPTQRGLLTRDGGRGGLPTVEWLHDGSHGEKHGGRFAQLRREKEPQVVGFFGYSPDNTKGSISNRSIRLYIQLLLWMMRVLMVVRLNRGSCGSLYLSGGCCSRSGSLTRGR